MLETLVGRTVQIIYMNRNRNISFRTIEIKSVGGGRVKAYCLTASAPRVFLIDRIIDVELVKRHAG
ncbi:hypothetical protein [Paenibacillus arenilitoris]|uniref:Uncharacterized protein n=1 Tax=Paenibacillus arenilitoris TaxID=2772299 RepID=A0A927H8C1_9BACL|nr:hypothetical protein [Paenibacillus arenilitoris]MBD2871412.1 hypothetical protein [Paenibacillus arenilitoris]